MNSLVAVAAGQDLERHIATDVVAASVVGRRAVPVLANGVDGRDRAERARRQYIRMR